MPKDYIYFCFSLVFQRLCAPSPPINHPHRTTPPPTKPKPFTHRYPADHQPQQQQQLPSPPRYEASNLVSLTVTPVRPYIYNTWLSNESIKNSPTSAGYASPPRLPCLRFTRAIPHLTLRRLTLFSLGTCADSVVGSTFKLQCGTHRR